MANFCLSYLLNTGSKFFDKRRLWTDGTYRWVHGDQTFAQTNSHVNQICFIFIIYLKSWLYYLQFVGSLIALFCVPFCLVSKTSCYKHVLNRFVVIVYGKCWLRFLLEKLWRLLARWFISVKQSYFIWFNFTLKRYWWKTWRNNIFNQLIYCLCN